MSYHGGKGIFGQNHYMKFVIVLLLAGFAANAQTEVALSRLPKQAQSTLAQFTGTTVEKIVTDGGQPTGHIATLNNGTTVTFDDSGSWVEIANPAGLSLDFLPTAVKTTLTKRSGTRAVRAVTHRSALFIFDLGEGSYIHITAKGEDQTPG